MGEEARTGKRFPLELPIKIHKGETATPRESPGISARQACTSAPTPPWRLVRPWNLKSRCHPEMTGGQENVTIQCKGRVVRADETGEGGEGRGVACVIDSYEFVRNS